MDESWSQSDNCIWVIEKMVVQNNERLVLVRTIYYHSESKLIMVYLNSRNAKNGRKHLCTLPFKRLNTPTNSFLGIYLHSSSKWWNIFNFQVARTSKLCICPLNGPMGLNLLEMVSYTYKLHHVSLVWLSLRHKR